MKNKFIFFILFLNLVKIESFTFNKIFLSKTSKDFVKFLFLSQKQPVSNFEIFSLLSSFSALIYCKNKNKINFEEKKDRSNLYYLIPFLFFPTPLKSKAFSKSFYCSLNYLKNFSNYNAFSYYKYPNFLSKNSSFSEIKKLERIKNINPSFLPEINNSKKFLLPYYKKKFSLASNVKNALTIIKKKSNFYELFNFNKFKKRFINFIFKIKLIN